MVENDMVMTFMSPLVKVINYPLWGMKQVAHVWYPPWN